VCQPPIINPSVSLPKTGQVKISYNTDVGAHRSWAVDLIFTLYGSTGFDSGVILYILDILTNVII
jgi:hypothetical protein